MNAYQQLFKRYEKKYRLTQSQYTFIKEAMMPYMMADAYGKHLIQNIYYDSPQYDLIRQSIEKPLYKEKLRLRCYGEADATTVTYLEIKKKFKGIVYKRRIQLPHLIASAYACGQLSQDQVKPYLDQSRLDESLQVLCEIDWMIKRHQLKPTVYIGYEREAYQSRSAEDFRITFDSELTFRTSSLTLENDRICLQHNENLTEEPLYLMEVKTPGNMPLWFTALLSAAQIFPASFSKYGHCYKAHLAPQFIKSLSASRPIPLKSFEQPSLITGGHLYA